jgi:acetyl esterase/lipase
MIRRHRARALLVGLWGWLAFGTPLFAQPATPTHADLAYGVHASQRLDLYMPHLDGGPAPLVVWIHGGGWQNGDKFPMNATFLRSLRDAGFAVASINYRLTADAAYPAQIHDCKAAIRWLRAHAGELAIDPARFGTWGSSAGGHLSALVGTTCDSPEHEGTVGGNLGQSSCVQAVADYFGPTDMCSMGTWHNECDSPESLLIDGCLGEVCASLANPPDPAAAWRALSASPLLHVSDDDPPFHIAHGTADMTVPVAQSEALHEALLAAGVAATFRTVAGAGHGLPLSEVPPVIEFFRANLSIAVNPDVNGDGVTDLADAEALLGCLRGPGAAVAGACGDADMDGDADVDLRDVVFFQRSFSP